MNKSKIHILLPLGIIVVVCAAVFCAVFSIRAACRAKNEPIPVQESTQAVPQGSSVLGSEATAITEMPATTAASTAENAPTDPPAPVIDAPAASTSSPAEPIDESAAVEPVWEQPTETPASQQSSRTSIPSNKPTFAPSDTPTPAPTLTAEPTAAPSEQPTETPASAATPTPAISASPTPAVTPADDSGWGEVFWP